MRPELVTVGRCKERTNPGKFETGVLGEKVRCAAGRPPPEERVGEGIEEGIQELGSGGRLVRGVGFGAAKGRHPCPQAGQAWPISWRHPTRDCHLATKAAPVALPELCL